MKIDSGAAQQAFAAYRSATEPVRSAGQVPADAAPTKVQRQDLADISPQGRRRAQALDAVQAAPDTREQLVADLRNQIKAGTYKVDEQALAHRLVQRGTVGS